MIPIKLIKYKSALLEKYSYLDLLVITLIFMFFVTILLNATIAKASYSILTLIALYLLATRQLTFGLSRLEKLFLFSIAASFLWIVISYFVNGMPEKGSGWLIHRQLRLFMLIPIYLMLRDRVIPTKVWWLSVSFGAIISGFVAIFEVSWSSGWPTGFADGDTNAIFFGEISLCLAFITLTGIKTFFSLNKYTYIFCLSAFFFALLAMILSGSRSAWVAIPILVVITFWYLTKNVSIYKRILILISLLTIPVILFQFPNTQIKYNAAEKQLNEYLLSDNIQDSVHSTSVGLRLDTWKVMLITIKENPLFGIGIGAFKEEVKKYYSQGIVDSRMTILVHSHNQYIETALNSGVLGLVFFLGILIFPCLIFYKSISNNTNYNLPYAISGLLIIVAFLVFGFTDVTLIRKVPIIFFGLSISILLSIIHQNNILEKNSV